MWNGIFPHDNHAGMDKSLHEELAAKFGNVYLSEQKALFLILMKSKH